jgi:hypothetical protein
MDGVEVRATVGGTVDVGVGGGTVAVSVGGTAVFVGELGGKAVVVRAGRVAPPAIGGTVGAASRLAWPKTTTATAMIPEISEKTREPRA